MQKKVIIKMDGLKVRVEAVNFTGSECFDATYPYTEILLENGEVTYEELKPEYYQGLNLFISNHRKC
jgi:hypothetical protein